MATEEVTTNCAGQKALVTANVVSLRAEADGDTELVTQALMGQTVALEKVQGDWYYVQTWDTYRGWIPSWGIKVLDEQAKQYASSGHVAVVCDLWANVHQQADDQSLILTKATIGAEIEFAECAGDWAALRLPRGDTGYVRKSAVKIVDKDQPSAFSAPAPEDLIETASRFIGVPYLWGGGSPFGIDCSGFVQLIHKIHGVSLLRDAGIQAGDARCQTVEREDVRKGDLVFFGKGKSPDIHTITHIGMAIDNEWFIHSGGQGGVQVTRFDDPNSRYFKRYWGARRMSFDIPDISGARKD